MNCLLCGGPTDAFVCPKGSVYHECLLCGFIILDPRFHPSFQEAEKRYRLHTNGPEDSGYVSYLNEFIDSILIPRIPQGSRLLDYGSGPVPVLPSLLEKAGYSVDIHDPHFAPEEIAPDRKFGGIILLEVAEHLDDPQGCLLRLRERLEPAGLLFVRTKFRPAERTDFLHWWYREDPTHISFYTRTAMEKIADHSGFSLAFCDGLQDTVFLRRD